MPSTPRQPVRSRPAASTRFEKKDPTICRIDELNAVINQEFQLIGIFYVKHSASHDRECVVFSVVIPGND
jgi:hypothetical protein